MTHEKEIVEELSGYGLEPKDLTREELAELDSAIGIEKDGGTVLDGIRSALPEMAYRKAAQNPNK